MSECEHKFVYKGAHVTGEETWRTSVPMKTLFDVFFCEKCLVEKRKLIESGYHLKVPQNATTSGYGFR